MRYPTNDKMTAGSAAIAMPSWMGATTPVRRTEVLLSIEEAITLLVTRLGSPVAWNAWLGDLRRTPREGYPVPDLYGQQLLPIGKVAGQPKYRLSDVHKFIKAILAAAPHVKKANGPRRFVFDDYGPLQPWASRKLRRAILLLKPALLFIRKS